jgi:hypothetical protein
MTITTYDDYRQAADAIYAAIAAIEAGYAPKHAACLDAAAQKYQDCLGHATTSSEATACSNQHRLDESACVRKRNAAIGPSIQAQIDALRALEDEARRKLIRLPRMIVASRSLESEARRLSTVDWDAPTKPSTEVAPVVTVRTFDDVEKVFAVQRFVNLFALLLPVDNGEFVLGTSRLSPAALASKLAATNKLQVSDVLYVPAGAWSGGEPLRAMVGAGLLKPLPQSLQADPDLHAAADEDEICLTPAIELGPQGGSGFGTIAERYIEQNYCQTVGPCDYNDFFDDFNPSEWRQFIAAHDYRFWSPEGRQRLEDACDQVGDRPDIATAKAARWEYYEIKPLSPSGVVAGWEKLMRIAGLMNELEQRYRPGTTYRGATIPIAKGTVKQLPLRVWLEVKLDDIDGLLVYQLCLAGDLKKLLALMTLGTLILIVIGAILAGIAGAGGGAVGPLIPLFVL